MSTAYDNTDRTYGALDKNAPDTLSGLISDFDPGAVAWCFDSATSALRSGWPRLVDLADVHSVVSVTLRRLA